MSVEPEVASGGLCPFSGHGRGRGSHRGDHCGRGMNGAAVVTPSESDERLERAFREFEGALELTDDALCQILDATTSMARSVGFTNKETVFIQVAALFEYIGERLGLPSMTDVEGIPGTEDVERMMARVRAHFRGNGGANEQP